MFEDKSPPIIPLEQHDILNELGLDNSPRAAGIARRVANDNQVLSIAQRLATEAFIGEALKLLTPEQKEKLLKRTQPEPQAKSAAQKPRVIWTVAKGGVSQEWAIHGHCYRGNESLENVRFTGNPDRAHLVRFRGESIPTEIIEQYKNLKPGQMPVGDDGYSRMMKPSACVQKPDPARVMSSHFEGPND